MAEELEEAVSKLTILSDRFREGDWKDDLKTYESWFPFSFAGLHS
jgi:hypothetical protein